MRQRLLVGCGGYLLAVLWMDLMFDVQVWGHGPGPLPEGVVASIAAYYARVTLGAMPMGYVIGGVMGVTLLGVLHQLLRGTFSLRLRVVTALCAGIPISLALLRVFPNAVELGSRTGDLAHQSQLARVIFREHVACILLVSLFLGIQLGRDVRRGVSGPTSPHPV